jgi:hypothetical protein
MVFSWYPTNRPSGDTMMALTLTEINAAKPKCKPYKLTDGLGLYLLVTERGGRSWRMNYSFLGKQKALIFRQLSRCYARGTHWDERVKMMHHWSNYLESLQGGAKIIKANFRRKH